MKFPSIFKGAQAFANTIPFSESIGFIASLEGDEGNIDYPFYVTSHELAHQWFAHQICGGQVPGFTMLTESLAQYGALMVMEKHYGKEYIKKFLQYELDTYFQSRYIAQPELPLAEVEGQEYIGYNKASLVFYRLKEEIGEAKLNQVISQFIKEHGFAANKETLPTAPLLVDALIVAAPEKKKLIKELFYKIIFYDNEALEAKKIKGRDGAYTLEMKVSLKKIEAKSQWKEKDITFSEEVPVGVRNKEGEFIYYKTHKLSEGEDLLRIKVKEEPFKAGIDPLNIFLDREPKNNEIDVL